MAQTIVVIGAGVAGLTTALLLSENPRNVVTVVAKDMPGDHNAEYASPKAVCAMKKMSRWERRTWRELKRLAVEAPEAAVHFQLIHLQRRHSSGHNHASDFEGAFATKPWFAELFDDFRELDRTELVPGYHAGCAFTSVCINTAIYLPWLLGQCVRNGVVFRRVHLNGIKDACGLSHTRQPAGIIVNCTSLGSRTLSGVRDHAMLPARGQIVLVQNTAPSMLMLSETDDGEHEGMYVMTRAAGGGTILGGTYELGNFDSNPDPNVAARIMQRVVEACPELADNKGVKGLSVVRHAVGFWPHRVCGARVEKEQLNSGTWIIHNYGHDSWGYIESYGCAEDVVELSKEISSGGISGEGRRRHDCSRTKSRL